MASSHGVQSLEGALRVEITQRSCTLSSQLPTHRTLFVLRVGEGVVFSSSLAVLERCLELRCSPASLAANSLMLGLSQAPFEAVDSLPAGCRWSFSCTPTGVVRTDEQLGPRSLPEIDDRASAFSVLRGALREAVAPAAQTTGKIGVLFSGGLDSSAVLSTLLESYPAERIAPIAWRLHAHQGDMPYLRAWERKLGRTLEWVDASDCASLVESSLVLDAAPTALMSGPFERAACRRALEVGADVLLTGVGGDEIFGGSLQAAVRDGSTLAEAFSRALRAQLPWDPDRWMRVSELLVRPALRPWIPRWLRERTFQRRAAAGLPSQLTERYRAPLRQAARLHIAHAKPLPTDALGRWHDLVDRPFWREMARLRSQWEESERITRVDVPLDPAVACAMASIAPRLLFEGAFQRSLLRSAIDAPQIVVARHDKAEFEPFMSQVFDRSSALPRLRELSQGQALQRHGLAPAGGLFAPEPLGTAPNDIGEWVQRWPFLAAEAFLQERGL